MDDYNTLTLGDKLERRALTLAYLRERDASASTAVTNASAETWEAKTKTWVRARANYIKAQMGNGWIPFYIAAILAADKADGRAYNAYMKACFK